MKCEKKGRKQGKPQTAFRLRKWRQARHNTKKEDRKERKGTLSFSLSHTPFSFPTQLNFSTSPMFSTPRQFVRDIFRPPSPHLPFSFMPPRQRSNMDRVRQLWSRGRIGRRNERARPEARPAFSASAAGQPTLGRVLWTPLSLRDGHHAGAVS